MKKLNSFFAIIIFVLSFSACELDNYDGPDATLYGSFIDSETNELVEQDIINGINIELKEHGYDPVTSQYLIAKVDGTYRNTMLFSNTYTVQAIKTNFIQLPAKDVVIKGETKLDFIVQPYIRLKNVNIVKSGSKVVATFQLQQTVPNKVRSIMLFSHPEPNLGQSMNKIQVVQEIDAVVDENQIFTLEIDIESNKNNFIYGDQYFFRVGALIDAPEAKPNYAPAVRLTVF